MATQTDDNIYLAEQRRFRRLEVSLPVWLALEENFDRPDGSPWSLGYTRDISMGGSKVFVASGEEKKWNEARQGNKLCLLRFDAPNIGSDEYITGRVKHVAHDHDSGNIWLGVEYEEGANEVKSASVRAGLQTVKARRRWQSAFGLLLLVLGLSGFFITKLRAQNQAQQQQITHLNKQKKDLGRQMALLSQPGLVTTRAQGIEQSFERKDVQARIKALTADISKLSSDKNIESGSMIRDANNTKEGINIDTSTGGSTINLGVAWPQGYAWPQTTTDLEEILGRHIPTVVIFKDFKSPFPIADCREAKVRAKTLEVTWEPWLNFIQPIPLNDITAGKYDKYIDSWATGAKAFGSEVWIRWGHEFNGNWYPWSIAANNKNPKAYVNAFRHVHDRFSRVGAFNVRWVWCMNAQSVPSVITWNDPLLAYPGDQYVDLVAIDGYNFGTAIPSSKWLSFDEVFAGPYQKIVSSKQIHHPIIINEIGCATVGGDKVKWLNEMDQSLRRKFPKIQGLIWFEAQKEADWRMASDLNSLKTCARIFHNRYYQTGAT